jgi:hypothetical protein
MVWVAQTPHPSSVADGVGGQNVSHQNLCTSVSEERGHGEVADVHDMVLGCQMHYIHAVTTPILLVQKSESVCQIVEEIWIRYDRLWKTCHLRILEFDFECRLFLSFGTSSATYRLVRRVSGCDIQQ